MPDFQTTFDSTSLTGDLSVIGAALKPDAGLETAVVLSLFTDARAEDGDRLPDDETDPRGWWGDVAATVDGDRFGSRLWLLKREKQTQETLNRARTYAEEALAWLIDDGIATAVLVEAEWISRGLLGLGVTIALADGAISEHHFNTAVGGV